MSCWRGSQRAFELGAMAPSFVSCRAIPCRMRCVARTPIRLPHDSSGAFWLALPLHLEPRTPRQCNGRWPPIPTRAPSPDRPDKPHRPTAAAQSPDSPRPALHPSAASRAELNGAHESSRGEAARGRPAAEPSRAHGLCLALCFPLVTGRGVGWEGESIEVEGARQERSMKCRLYPARTAGPSATPFHFMQHRDDNNERWVGFKTRGRWLWKEGNAKWAGRERVFESFVFLRHSGFTTKGYESKLTDTKFKCY